jgi:hypothetical protein
MRSFLVVPSVGAALCFASAALADTNSVTAEALFQQGRALLDAGRVSEACPKLAESHRLEPATGALIALAVCHETEGKLASAWAEFMEARGRARREGQPEREQLALERAAALENRVSLLTIQVPEGTVQLQGIEILLDGVALRRSAWNTAVTIDGGEHRLEVSAPGHRPFQTTFEVRRENDRARVSVPPLEALPENEQPKGAPLATATPRSGRLSTLSWVGIGTAGAGVAALGAGGYFLATALGQRSDSEGQCDGDQCSPAGVDSRRDAVHNGNLATLFAIGGGVLVATGATLFFVGRSSSSEETPAVQAGAGLTSNGVSLAVRGAF